MAKCLVTGVAGFIGSHLAEGLLAAGHQVLGIDCLSDYYARKFKEANLKAIGDHPDFQFVEGDLCTMPLGLIEGVSYVFHKAAQPGVRKSWGNEFTGYVQANILATQRLLEAVYHLNVIKFIYASSSSVYGDSLLLPLSETTLPRPISPYGVTKLAGEHLVGLYHRAYNLPTISLRYFTVYGPRQRPDMAFYRFIRSLYLQDEITVYGDGEQTRDFTYIGDVVRANLAAMTCADSGLVLNIGGGSRTTVNHCLQILARVSGQTPHVRHLPSQPGDVRHTYAETLLASAFLKYKPLTNLETGLVLENNWFVDERLPYEQEYSRADDGK